MRGSGRPRVRGPTAAEAVVHRFNGAASGRPRRLNPQSMGDGFASSVRLACRPLVSVSRRCCVLPSLVGMSGDEPPGSSSAGRRWDFFVSYTQADRAWAEWVAWQLEEMGFRVLFQA
jgi:hypothetical protein